jgi:hypothetical protein
VDSAPVLGDRSPLVWLAALVLFAVVFITHGESRVTTANADSRWSIFIAHSILHEGNTDLNEFEPELQRQKDYCIHRINGKAYGLFPLAPAFIAVPFVALYEYSPALASRILPGMGSVREFISKNRQAPSVFRVRDRLERAAASFVVALTTVILFGMALEFVTLPWAIGVAILFAFGTSAWSIASRSLWQHGPSMLMTSLSLYLTVLGARSPRATVCVGFPLAAAYVARPTNAVFVVALLIFHFMRNRALLGYILLPFSFILGLFSLLSLNTYGTLVPPYYQPNRLTASDTFIEAVAGNLISPARGLFVFSPVLILSIWGAFLLFRHTTYRLLPSLLIASFLGHLVAISLFPHWWGGHSYGPRLMSDTLPTLIFFLLPAIRFIGTGPNLLARPKTYVLAVLTLLSFLVHHHGATHQSALRWDRSPVSVDQEPERVWDWSDPPFLR